MGKGTNLNTKKNIHHGHAIKRFRLTLGIKQDSLANEMGISQSLVSFYEHKRIIDPGMINKFALALQVEPTMITELEEDPVKDIIAHNTPETCGMEHSKDSMPSCQPDLMLRIIELSEEKAALFERALELEEEKNLLLEKLLKEWK